jgi:hypothetical protein
MFAIAIPGGIAGLAIWVIIVAAIAAIVFVACKAMGVAIPGWVVNVFWIVVIAVVCILAIKFLVGAV